MWSAILSPDFFSTILRSATPILFATLAAAVAAKADRSDPCIFYPESEDG